MRKAVFAITVFAAFAFVDPASAIVQNTETTITKTGSEVPSQTITITQKDSSGKVVDTKSVRVTERKKAHTRIRIDTRKTKTVEITYTANGREESKTVAVEDFLSGTIDLGHGLTIENTPVTAERRPRSAGRQPSAVRAMPNVADHWIGRGVFIAGSLIFNSADLGITEKSADTGETTFHSNENNTATGGGVSILFTPAFIGGGTAIFVSVDFPNTKVEHVFSGGSAIGESIKFIISGGLQFPLWPLQPYMPAYFQLYGVAGLALVEKEFIIFSSTDEQWLWGGTLGIGIMYSGPELRGWRAFAQYQHIWVEQGDVRMPSSSPGFNYSFDNEMDLVKLGLAVSLGGPGGLASDIRLKRDIELVRRFDDGLGLYRYRYFWSETEYVGVMAQEVEKIVPDAVMRGSDGYLRVDYGRLGLKLVTWREWLASAATK
jgi:hypothetical protein